MPSRKEIKVIEQAFEPRDEWFEDGIGAGQARIASGNMSNFPIDLKEVDNI
jgi:predicted transcriptional regulator